MGNCRGKISTPPDRGYETHSVTKHQLRLGLQGGKDETGQIIVGVKGGVDNIKDKIVIVNANEVIVKGNKIPKLSNIMNNEEPTKDSRNETRIEDN